MKKALKRLLAVSCAATLFMTAPGVSVLADEIQEEEIVLSEINEDEGIQETQSEEIAQEEDNEKLTGTASDSVDVLSEDTEVPQDSDADEAEYTEEIAEDNISDEETVIDSTEELVGDNTWTAGEGVTASFDEETGTVSFSSDGGTLYREWLQNSSLEQNAVKSIQVESGKVYLPTDSSYIFCNFTSLTNIDLSGFDTSNVENMRNMFDNCIKVKNLDMTSFDTSSVTNMSYMFYECGNLVNLDMSSFVTSNVTNMSYMFSNCSKLTDVDMGKFDTSYVTDIGGMFSDCINLKSLDLSNLNTSRVTNMSWMFSDCRNLSSVDLSSLDTSSVTNMNSMFYNCCNLTSIDLSSFDTSNVTNMSWMFTEDGNLINLDLSSFDTSNVVYMNLMFNNCNSLESLDLSSFDMTYVSDLEYWVDSCRDLQILKTPKKSDFSIKLPATMYDQSGNTYTEIPPLDESLTLVRNPKTIAYGKVTLKEQSYVFTGSPIHPEPEITLAGKTLVAGTDYELTYKNDVNVGTATVTANGKGDYEGAISCTYEITPRDISDGSASTKSKTYAYTGSPRHPDMVLVVNSITLVKNVDYKLTYENDTEIGTATVTAHGTGNYKGDISCTFEIIYDGPLPIERATITTKSPSYVYTGTPRNPKPLVQFGDKTLVLGTDYDLTYENDVNVGTGTVIAHGKGIYDGTVSCNFEITPRDISDGTASTKSKTYAFTGSPRHPAMILVVNNKTLVKDVDFTLTYENDTEIGTATVTAHGIGNYTGEKSCTFGIVLEKPTTIQYANITTKSPSYVYTGTPRRPSPIITLGGKTLVKGTDYDLSYKDDLNVGTATVTATGKGDYKGTVSCKYGITPRDISDGTASTRSWAYLYTGTPRHPAMILVVNNKTLVKDKDYTLSYENEIAAGTATVTANGIGNYQGQKSCTFEILEEAIDISACSIAGNSLSYGYSGKAYTPAVTVKLNGVTLTKDTDYTVTYKNNTNPGTASITVTGKGLYKGTRTKTFEIVDCVSTLVSGKTYQLIPKNNSKTAVSSFGGRMVNNTKVYITDRSNSEAMKFKAIQNADGTWKFINAKCELALAVRSNSSEVGKELVLYDQTTRKQQNWKLTRKSDNSFGIINAVSGLYVAMSDDSAVKGTTLSMEENSGRGQQRFYIAETTAVSAPFDGTRAVKASKNKNYAVSIASASKEDGANVNLAAYSNSNDKKFNIIYSGGGYYRLVNVNSKLVLTVEGNTKTNGANVIQSAWAGESGQRWKITKNSNGTVTLTNALGTVLHLNGNSTTNGANVLAKSASATGAQKWYLE